MLLQMLAEVPQDKRKEAGQYLKAVQDGLKKVQGAIDLKWVPACSCLSCSLHMSRQLISLCNFTGFASLIHTQSSTIVATCKPLLSQVVLLCIYTHIHARCIPG